LRHYIKHHRLETEESSLPGCDNTSLSKQLPFLLGLPDPEDKDTKICHGLLLCENKKYDRQPSLWRNLLPPTSPQKCRQVSPKCW
jgi:hypothetical protein